MDSKITDLQQFLNKHKDKEVIVMGAGVSLKDLTKEDVKGKIVIAVNGAIMKFDKVDYFFTCDPSIFNHKYADEIYKRAKTVIIANPTHEPKKKNEVVIDRKYHMTTQQGGNRIEEFDFMRKSDSKLIVGKDSVQVAVHFAHIISEKNITLKGVDMKFTDGERYFTELPFKKEKGIV